MSVSLARHRRPLAVSLAAVMLSIGLAADSSAQETGAEGRFRFGPLRFTPSVMLTNLGVDTNVFNEADDPKRDKTGMLAPSVNLWLRPGPTRLSGSITSQYVYFEKYKSQRTFNTGATAKWEVPLGRLTPSVDGSYTRTKRRPNYEIDARVGQSMQSVGLGSEIRLSGRTTITLGATQSRTAFDNDAVFLGENLASALNVRTNSERLQLRYKLTSLTTFAVLGEALQDRFGAGNIRNSNSIRMLSGFELKPAALIAGNVFVGFRDFQPLDPTLPPSRGPIAEVDATLTARRMRVALKVSRDIEYSFQAVAPYYTMTDATVSITQRFARSWDVIVRGGRQTLDYTQLVAVPAGVLVPLDETPSAGAALSAVPGVDTIRQYGGGIGLRLGPTLRLGLEAMHYQRSASGRSAREYRGVRAGGSVTYGLQQ